jgi:hypothetical protein
MNSRITMSKQKRTWLTFMGIVALCVAGVLTFLFHFASQNISGSLASKITLVATWSVGAKRGVAVVPGIYTLGQMARIAAPPGPN